MPTNAEIKALIETRVRAQRSHILHDGVAEILDFMVDNISAGPGGTPGIDTVLAEAQALTAERNIDLNGNTLRADHLGNKWLYLDSIAGESGIGSFNAAGNVVKSHYSGGDLDPYFYISSEFNGGQHQAYIQGATNAGGSNMGAWANIHEWYDEADEIEMMHLTTTEFTVEVDMIIASLAGGGTTGLSIDNDGRIIRTP